MIDFQLLFKVKLTGSHLSQQIYAMISYMQSTQTNEQISMNASTTTKLKDKKKSKNVGKVLVLNVIVLLCTC